MTDHKSDPGARPGDLAARQDEHPAIRFNRWFETGACGDPFFPGLYEASQLRAVGWLAFEAGRADALAEAQATIMALTHQLREIRAQQKQDYDRAETWQAETEKLRAQVTALTQALKNIAMYPLMVFGDGNEATAEAASANAMRDTAKEALTALNAPTAGEPR